ncbi:hypothetical protein QS306_11115 [Paraburkholderia bonniea]|uniref:hypothetical protein n=1 Tax=Paraburkholderia bonniea TaxID=2152891 RepID=UPI0012914C5C|nr:hypothetical protein [Paraburkholderia bonniea]WJF89653.1 hypothetical protein QS306_11115 [Paraburkholderia bonniea]WJF92967.1 hypothetical protein QS308_11125 [Paraburkholderia bonniea]
MDQNKIDSFIKPIFRVEYVRKIFYTISAVLFLVAILFPAEISSDHGTANKMCQFFRFVPIVRAFGALSDYPCTVAVAYGPAICLGFFGGIFLCFCKFKEPIDISFISEWGKMQKISTVIFLCAFVAGSWLVSQPPSSPRTMGIFISNRLGIAVGASGYFGATMVVWAVLICIGKFYFFNSGDKK